MSTRIFTVFSIQSALCRVPTVRIQWSRKVVFPILLNVGAHKILFHIPRNVRRGKQNKQAVGSARKLPKDSLLPEQTVYLR